MADTSLFGRLRRLFSNDVVVRNVGGDQLKILMLIRYKLPVDTRLTLL